MKTQNQTSQNIFTYQRQQLFGTPTNPIVSDSRQQTDSIVIWPTTRAVSVDDYAEVTLWEATPAAQAEYYPEQPVEFVQFSALHQPQPAHSTKRSLLKFALLSIMIVSLIVMASVVVPDVYYRLLPEQATDVASTTTLLADSTLLPAESPVPEPTLPKIDPALPAGEWLRIPAIGVDAVVTAEADSQDALKKGAWMVPDFGRPSDYSQPTIIASHRYGWLWWWQSDFGKKNSFYYLPDTKPGDRIEVIDGQRKYEYEIYAQEEGKLISDYSADLILYTCKFLNSPERYFVYAKRLPVQDQPTAQDSQSGGAAVFDKT